MLTQQVILLLAGEDGEPCEGRDKEDKVLFHGCRVLKETIIIDETGVGPVRARGALLAQVAFAKETLGLYYEGFCTRCSVIRFFVHIA